MFLRTLILFFMPLNVIHSWGADDEQRRIQAIIEEEERSFNEEMKPQTQMKYKQKFGGPSLYYSERGEFTGSPRAEPLTGDRQGEIYSQDENWCYSCVTPLQLLSKDMQTSVKNFLQMSRTEYPKEHVTQECLNGRNVSKIHKQKCLHKYCQTLVLNDHNQGASFVLRGCAENFGAVDPKKFEEKEENSCTKLHHTLDIRECICKNRHFCFASHSFRKSSNNPFSVFLSFLTGFCIAFFLLT
ncbi:unnamed protein product, partial [Mesorhabditis spiculigera]